LLIRREGLADLDALDHRRRELVELDRALVLVRGRQAHAVELTADVAIGQAADDRRLAVLDGRARDQAQGARGVAGAGLAHQIGADRIHHGRARQPQFDQRRLGAAAKLEQVSDHELLHLGVVAGERRVRLGELASGDQHVGAHHAQVTVLREDQRVAAGRDGRERVVAEFRSQHAALRQLDDRRRDQRQRRVEVAVGDDAADRAGRLLRRPRERSGRAESHEEDRKDAPDAQGNRLRARGGGVRSVIGTSRAAEQVGKVSASGRIPLNPASGLDEGIAGRP
jgi:hypothetical protein